MFLVDHAMTKKEKGSEMRRYWYGSETKKKTGFDMRCCKCGHSAHITSSGGEVIEIICDNQECINEFTIKEYS